MANKDHLMDNMAANMKDREVLSSIFKGIMRDIAITTMAWELRLTMTTKGTNMKVRGATHTVVRLRSHICY